MDASSSLHFVLVAAIAQAAQIALSRVHEVPTIKFLVVYTTTAVILLTYLLLASERRGALWATGHFLLLNTVFIAVIAACTGIRRLFFHPLRSFPGKRRAALTKLYEAYLNGQGQNAPSVRQLHLRYGDFVRTGPDELSVNNVAGVAALLGRHPYDTRGPFYEMSTTVDEFNVLTTRDNKTHQKWRRIWDTAFRSQALAQYTPRVEAHVQRFIQILQGLEGRQADAVKLLSNLAFDIMADLGFGAEYGMQDGKADPSYIGYIHEYMHMGAMIGSLRNICQLIPVLPEDPPTKAFKAKGKSMLEKRIAIGQSREDVFSYLLNEDEQTGAQFTKMQLYANTQLLVIAGTDTTSSVLANIFRELALNPEAQKRLHAEIHSTGTPKDHRLHDIGLLKSLPYLSAIIDEALRLWPPVPSGAQAITGPDGITVDGTYIPPHTAVRVPPWTMMRDERYFPEGERFIPERWTGERPELVKDRRAYIPFSYGPHSCVGKQLALNEIRLTVASVVERFGIQLAEAHDDEKYLRDWKDYFTVKLGVLLLRFVPRNQEY